MVALEVCQSMLTQIITLVLSHINWYFQWFYSPKLPQKVMLSWITEGNHRFEHSKDVNAFYVRHAIKTLKPSLQASMM